MGNAPSSEEPRKAPRRTLHRRSKLQTNQNALHDEPLSPGDSAALMSPRYSSFYLAGSLPPPGPERAATVTGTETGTWEEASRDVTGDGRHASWQDMEPSRIDEELRRSHSMTNIDRVTSLSRSQSFRSYTAQEKRMSLHSDMASYDAQRLGHLEQAFQQNLQIASAKSHLEMYQSNEAQSWNANAQQQPITPTSPISRTNSEVSSYAPMRRRSVVQMPGVATRSRREGEAVSAKLASRNSQPLLSTEYTFDRDEIKPERCLSMPPPPVGFEFQPRAVTPSDGDYRQLGGMEFGSLRITNGSPVPSLDLESEQRSFLHHTKNKSSHGRSFAERKEQISYAAIELESAGYIEQTPVSASEPHHNQDMTQESLRANSQLPSFTIQAPCDQPGYVDEVPDETKDSPAYTSPEVLDIRDDPNAKANPLDGQLGPHKNRQSVTRSDSGFGSTSSSKSSRKTLSKADSGYSSSFSLRSFRNSFSKREETDRRLRDMSNKQLSDDKEAQQLRSSGKSSKAKSNSSLLNDRPKSSIQSSASSMSLRGLRRLSMNPSKSHRPDTAVTRPAPSVSHSRTRSISAPMRPAITEQEQGLSRPTSKRSNYKQGKFYRFLVGSKEDILPPETGRHHICDTIPDVPSYVEQRLQEHSERFPTAPQRLALRFEASKETLLTIMSEEGSVDVGHCDRASTDRFRQIEIEPRDAMSTDRLRTRSLQTLIPTWPLNPPMSIKRKPLASTARGDDAARDRPRKGEVEAEMSRTNRRLSTPASANTHKRGARILTKPNPTEPIYLAQVQQPRQLSSRPSSTPNMRQLDLVPPSPSMPDLQMRRKTKTPPPVSMRTRSIKRRDVPPPMPSQPSPTELLPEQWALPSQQKSVEDLRVRTSHGTRQQARDQWSPNARPQGHFSDTALNEMERGHQPVYRQENYRAAARRDSGGRDASWNALHGYNPSAYQEVPVWG